MSMYGCWAMDLVCPLKLQKTWLSGYWPLVWFTMLSSSTWVAAGMALVLPQNDTGGSPLPPAVLTVQLKVAEPDAPVVSLAVTVVVPVAAAVGGPEIRPEVLVDSPAGRRAGAEGGGWPAAA